MNKISKHFVYIEILTILNYLFYIFAFDDWLQTYLILYSFRIRFKKLWKFRTYFDVKSTELLTQKVQTCNDFNVFSLDIFNLRTYFNDIFLWLSTCKHEKREDVCEKTEIFRVIAKIFKIRVEKGCGKGFEKFYGFFQLLLNDNE